MACRQNAQASNARRPTSSQPIHARKTPLVPGRKTPGWISTRKTVWAVDYRHLVLPNTPHYRTVIKLSGVRVNRMASTGNKKNQHEFIDSSSLQSSTLRSALKLSFVVVASAVFAAARNAGCRAVPHHALEVACAALQRAMRSRFLKEHSARYLVAECRHERLTGPEEENRRFSTAHAP